MNYENELHKSYNGGPWGFIDVMAKRDKEIEQRLIKLEQQKPEKSDDDTVKNWIAYSKYQNDYFPTTGSWNQLKKVYSKGDMLLEIPNNLKWIEL